MLATVSWDGGGDGTNWTDPLNWNTDALPGETDDVVIDVADTVTVTHASGTHSIKSLSSQETFVLSGGTLSIAEASQFSASFAQSGGILDDSSDLVVSGAWNWSAGTMRGSGKSTANGLLTLTGFPTLNGRTLDINAEAVVASGGPTLANDGCCNARSLSLRAEIHVSRFE